MRLREGAAKDLPGGGYLHRFGSPTGRPDYNERPLARLYSNVAYDNAEVLARSLEAAATADRLDRLAGQLGVSVDSLRALRVGWSSHRQSYRQPRVPKSPKPLCADRSKHMS